MRTPRFRITNRHGSIVGVVQGAGGPVQYIDHLRKAIRQANRGRDTHLYEPAPGHVVVYPDYSAKSNGPSVAVNLKGATVEVVP